MALAHAILALLVDTARSGYDLTKEFDSSVGYFWSATHQQIYRELAKLEDQGAIVSEVVPQTGRPDKKLYHLTERGHQQLVKWIAEPCSIAAIKEEILVKTFVGVQVNPSVLQQEIERHRQAHQQKLAVYHRIEAEYFEPRQPLSFAHNLQYLVLQRGIRYEVDWIGWCDEVLQLLSDHANDRPV